jgi:hypothetical protein
LSLKGDTLELGLKYEFHAEQIMSAKNKPIIENALSEVMNKKMFINAVVNTDLPSGGDEVDDEAVKDVMDTFGGKVVE